MKPWIEVIHITNSGEEQQVIVNPTTITHIKNIEESGYKNKSKIFFSSANGDGQALLSVAQTYRELLRMLNV
jgi:hypothetical protein